MTRINVGIKPEELCDQHLLAEWNEIVRPIAHRPLASPPLAFTLGKGHVNWCAWHKASLSIRASDLLNELHCRGFTYDVTYYKHLKEVVLGSDSDHLNYWQPHDESYARPQLQERILVRLETMSRTPSFTNREPPSWIVESLERR